ncbi:MAG: hypothetical protein ABFC78_04345 [Methanoregula sp.]
MVISATNHKEVAEPGAREPGAAGTGDENEELMWGRRHITWDNPVLPERRPQKPIRLADRVTALRDIGQAPGLEQPEKKPVRKIPGTQILSCDDDAAHCFQARELFDRQEKIAEALLVMINDLQYRVDDLEYYRRSDVPSKTGTRPGERL